MPARVRIAATAPFPPPVLPPLVDVFGMLAVKSVSECAKKCAAVHGCTIFDFNTSSGDYARTPGNRVGISHHPTKSRTDRTPACRNTHTLARRRRALLHTHG